jgi:predicted flap endonuclease-1-like 5' DNA nuclease
MKSENRNAPSLGGWIIAAAVGLVGFAVLVVIGKFDLFTAAFMAGGVAAVVGLILGMPWGASSAPVAAAPAPAVKPAAASEPAPVVTPAPAPAAVAEAAPADGPQRLSGPKGGKADNLKELEGVGPALEKLLNDRGFYHFDQIAAWSEADVAAVDAEMKTFKGRITRDKWVAQAKIIVTEGLEAFRERAKTNNY